jgi:hypothetical protein
MRVVQLRRRTKLLTGSDRSTAGINVMENPEEI